MKIREEIKHWMDVRGVNQATLCHDIGMLQPNFNGFLKGNRTMPKQQAVLVCDYLRITPSIGGNTFGYTMKDLSMFFLAAIKGRGYKVKDVAQQSGVEYCALSSFINGSRWLSLANIDKLIELFGIEFVSYRKKS